MKHFINILVILLLSAFAVGVAYMIRTNPSIDGHGNAWPVLYIPISIMMICWGIKLKNDYE